MVFREPTANESSLARDQLANERTFLAWIRTALGIVGVGIITARFLEAEGPAAESLGLGLIGMGSVILGYAVVHFKRVSAMIFSGYYRPALWGPLIVAVMCALLCAGSVALILSST